MSHLALMIPTIDRIGGAERQVLLLAAGLHRRGWNVTVIALAGTGGEAAEELKREGIVTSVWKCARDLPTRAGGCAYLSGCEETSRT